MVLDTTTAIANDAGGMEMPRDVVQRRKGEQMKMEDRQRQEHSLEME